MYSYTKTLANSSVVSKAVKKEICLRFLYAASIFPFLFVYCHSKLPLKNMHLYVMFCLRKSEFLEISILNSV